MNNTRAFVTCMYLSIACVPVGALPVQTLVYGISPSAIVMDGKLDESVWQNSPKIQIRHDIGEQLYQGSVNDHADCSMEFALLWDNDGLYCGSWTKDDIHNTHYAQQADKATSAWQDDGNLWWVNFDFDDVWEDASPPYFGQFGWMVYKGFVWENHQATDLYVAHANENQPTTSTREELTEQGFKAPYWSADGICFQCEAQFKWSSFLLGSMSAPSAGKELAFNIAIADNDGGSTGAAWLAWAEGMQHTYQGWGKAVIANSEMKDRRSQIAWSKNNGPRGMRGVDVFGRTLSIHRTFRVPGIVIWSPSHANAAKKTARLQ